MIKTCVIIIAWHKEVDRDVRFTPKQTRNPIKLTSMEIEVAQPWLSHPQMQFDVLRLMVSSVWVHFGFFSTCILAFDQAQIIPQMQRRVFYFLLKADCVKVWS